MTHFLLTEKKYALWVSFRKNKGSLLGVEIYSRTYYSNPLNEVTSRFSGIDVKILGRVIQLVFANGFSWQNDFKSNEKKI